MRMAMLCALSLAVGCGGAASKDGTQDVDEADPGDDDVSGDDDDVSGDDDDASGDDDDDASGSNGSTPPAGMADTGIVMRVLISEGTFNGSTWTGIQRDTFIGLTRDQVLCEHVWEATGTRPSSVPAPCTDDHGNPCDFTMSYVSADELGLSGSYCGDVFANRFSPLGDVAFDLGHISNYWYMGTDYGPQIMVYFEPSPPVYLEGYWRSVRGYSDVHGDDWTFQLVSGYSSYYWL